MDIEQQLRAALVPCKPEPALRAAVLARVSDANHSASAVRRKPGRFILFGTIVVVAAAAAMLTVSLYVSAPTIAAVAAPDPTPVATIAEARSRTPIQPVPKPVEKKLAPQEEVPAVKPFTVRVLPLQNEATDAASKGAVAAMYVAFVERLRKVPGLTLLDSDPVGSALKAQPNYRITIKGGVVSGNKFAGTLQAETLKPDGTQRGAIMTSSNGDVVPTCATSLPAHEVEADVSSCAGPEGVAATFIGVLRKMVFPPDPSLRRQLQVRLLDRSLNAQQRLRALTDLALLGRGYLVGPAPGFAGDAALRDPAVMRAAIDLATTAVDPLQRAQVWATLRGVGDTDLIGPLLTALRQDRDGEVRLAALETLAADFAEDPDVHAAFVATAQQDARPLVRAVAQRTVSGAGGYGAWKEYILSSLKDKNRSAIERIEALFYQMKLPTTAAAFGFGSYAANPQSGLRLLDNEAIKALAETLPIAAADSPIVQRSAIPLVNSLDQIDHPAITDMLLASLDNGSQWLDRGMAIQALGALASRRAEPRVRAALEKIIADDPSPQLRQMATASLQEDSSQSSADPNATQAALDGMIASAPSAEQPPRLGVALATESGPYVPKELIGKPVIRSVASESVAQKAGLMEGDVLLQINGTQISSPPDVLKILATVPKGVDVDVLVSRSGEAVSLKARF